jgi:hypothetical protein
MRKANTVRVRKDMVSILWTPSRAKPKDFAPESKARNKQGNEYTLSCWEIIRRKKKSGS